VLEFGSIIMQRAGSTLRKIFADVLRREGDDAPLLAWPLACGATIADKTRAVGYAEGVLTVAVPDVVWRDQLQSLSGQYLAALNRISTRQVSRIQFVAGSSRGEVS
jgi:hypothetical protein